MSDISSKTIEVAKNNLLMDGSIHLICEDYLTWKTNLVFDVIYSSLTFLHIKDKQKAIDKTYSLLEKKGTIILKDKKVIIF